MISCFKRKSLKNIIIDDDGNYMSDQEARLFLNWASKQGYESFNDIPDFLGKSKPWLEEEKQNKFENVPSEFREIIRTTLNPADLPKPKKK